MDVSSRKLANGLVQLAFSLGDQVSEKQRQILSFWILQIIMKISAYYLLLQPRPDLHLRFTRFIQILDSIQILDLQALFSFICFFTQTEQLVDLLLNSVTLSVPLSGSLNPHFLSFSHGEYFYSLFQHTVNAELMCHLVSSVPLLLNAATKNPNMVRCHL